MVSGSSCLGRPGGRPGLSCLGVPSGPELPRAVAAASESELPRAVAAVAAIWQLTLLVQVIVYLHDYRQPAVPVAVWIGLLAAALWPRPGRAGRPEPASGGSRGGGRSRCGHRRRLGPPCSWCGRIRGLVGARNGMGARPRRPEPPGLGVDLRGAARVRRARCLRHSRARRDLARPGAARFDCVPAGSGPGRVRRHAADLAHPCPDGSPPHPAGQPDGGGTRSGRRGPGGSARTARPAGTGGAAATARHRRRHAGSC